MVWSLDSEFRVRGFRAKGFGHRAVWQGVYAKIVHGSQRSRTVLALKYPLLQNLIVAGRESWACWFRVGFGAPETLNPKLSNFPKP